METEFIWMGKLLAAVLLAMPIAFNRESKSRSMGLRTFPLVSMGACAYVLIAQGFADPAAQDTLARIMQGLMAGIGFVGGGAIIKYKDYVLGTTSAASIWVTGALGAAVGFGFWEIAVFLSAANFAIVFFLSDVKESVEHDPEEGNDV